MALCRITGIVYLPSGEIAARREVTFVKEPDSVTADYLGAVLPEPIRTRTDNDGSIDLTLITGNYYGFILGRGGHNKYTFRAIVPDSATADFADLIAAVDPVEPLPSWLQQVIDARDEARASEVAAGVSAGEAADSADLAAALTAESPQSWAQFADFLDYADGKVVWFNGAAFMRDRSENIPGLAPGAGWSIPGDVTPYHFGWIGDPEGNNGSFKRSAQWAIDNNRKHVATGRVTLSDAIALFVNGTAVLDWWGAELFAAPGFPGDNKKMLTVTAGDNGPQLIDIRLGKLDCSNQPNSGAGQAHDAINLTPGRGYLTTRVEIGYAYAGEHWTVAGSDSFVMAVGDNIDINIHHGVGAPDLGVYASAPPSLTADPYRNLKVRGFFERCNMAVSAKRGFHMVDVDIMVKECISGGGYGVSEIEGDYDHLKYNETGTWKVSARNTERAFQGQSYRGLTVVVDTSDIGCATDHYTSGTACGVRLTSGSDSLVFVNAHRINPLIVSPAGSAFHTVEVSVTGNTPQMLSKNNRITGNTTGLGRIVVEGATGVSNNHYDFTYNDMLSIETLLVSANPSSTVLLTNLANGQQRTDIALRDTWLRRATEFVHRIIAANGVETGRLGFNSASAWEFRSSGNTILQVGPSGFYRLYNVPVHADNAAAIAAGLAVGRVYRDASGRLCVVFS